MLVSHGDLYDTNGKTIPKTKKSQKKQTKSKDVDEDVLFKSNIINEVGWEARRAMNVGKRDGNIN